MTEEELFNLHELKDEYWLAFSDLVNQILEKAPEHLRDCLLMMLQESSSVYGRKT